VSDGRPPEPVAGKPETALRVAENVAYLAVGVMLLVGAAAMVVSIAYHLVVDLGDGVDAAVTAALNGLLLVFILLELLAGVRATMVERKLVAEPFLVAGIIASIKEIILVSLEAKELTGPALDDAMLQIAVLGSVVLLLALASFVIRRKEREPEEA
jgi:uncharacterized membrane protein (DUF373 family)